jgi:hypothetical protein
VFFEWNWKYYTSGFPSQENHEVGRKSFLISLFRRLNEEFVVLDPVVSSEETSEQA